MSDKESQGIEERVKVDRKKFEQMLGDEAESFFGRVMKATGTLIMWPPKLKPGTKSKKDPHVRITGSPNSINLAKEMIFEQLDTRRNRVTLKMDVAFTDHSHIIGKDLEMLLSFGEANLAELGLPYTHRRKLAIAIAEVKSMMQNNEQRGSSTFDAAPGAERSRRQKTGPSYDLKDVWPM